MILLMVCIINYYRDCQTEDCDPQFAGQFGVTYGFEKFDLQKKSLHSSVNKNS